MDRAEFRELAPLLDRLRRHCRPLQVWLFGSRARGSSRADSDWDVAAVLPDDVVVFPRSEFEEDRTTPNTIPFVVAREGILLDER